MARKFFYVCAGMLMLALSYHFGASTATAQAPGNSVVAVSDPWVYTANGDAYIVQSGTGPWLYVGNVFGSGAPTSTSRETWGQVKSRYAPPRASARPGAQGR